MSPAPSTLDHLILLVPSLLEQDLAPFNAAGFELLPGGTHADGLTENVLVPLQDGIYLELIAFTANTSPEERAKHWWGKKQVGWIDWSCLPSPLSAVERVKSINDLSPGAYDEPQAGGRLNKQGQNLKWNVAFPVVAGPGIEVMTADQRGRRPFWCEDVSPRAWRVPGRDSAHENGVEGVSSLVLLSRADNDSFNAYLAALDVILPQASDEGRNENGTYELKSPLGSHAIRVSVRRAETVEEREWVRERGEGLYEVSFKTVDGTGRGPSPVQLNETGARIRFV